MMNEWLSHLLFRDEDPRSLPIIEGEENFLPRLLEEDIAPLVYYQLKKMRLLDTIPQEVKASLEDFFLLNLARNFRIRIDVSNLLKGFHAHHFPSILLKGLALISHYYPHPATRRMTDADILIKKENLPAIDKYLASLGYRPIDSTVSQAIDNPSGYLASLEYHTEDERPIIHLHWHVINTSVPFFFPYPLEDLWQTAHSINLEGVPALIPSPEHMCLHLAEHGLRVNHSYARLILIYDLYALIRCAGRNMNWGKILSLADYSGLSPFLYFSFLHLEKWAGPIIPCTVKERVQPLTLSPLQHLYVWFIEGDVRIRGLSYLLYLSLLSGVRGKSKFVFSTFFPPRRISRQRVRDHKRPAVKIYFSRLWEIARLGGRVFLICLLRLMGGTQKVRTRLDRIKDRGRYFNKKGNPPRHTSIP